MKKTSPRIVCYACNFIACRDDLKLLDNVNLVRVSCIGRLDLITLVETFEKGVDGVVLAGCSPPDCHYVEGNIQAERSCKVLKSLLSVADFEPERLKLVWYTPLEDAKLEEDLKEHVKEVKKLSPMPLGAEGFESDRTLDMLAIKNTASDFQLRLLLGREKELTENADVYGDKITQAEFDWLLNDIVKTLFVRHKIHILTQKVPKSVIELSEATGLKPATVLRHVVSMRRQNMLTFDHLEGQTPLYKALEAS